MALSELLLDGDALLITREGPTLARKVEAGTDVLGLQQGTQEWARVNAVRVDHEPAAARRICTVAGVAVVADGMRAEGGRGPTRAEELREGDLLELVHPTDLATFDRAPSPLRGLPSLTRAVPTNNGCADAVEASLDALLMRAGLRSKRQFGGRWMAVRVSPVQAVEWTWDEEADLVSILYAWEAAHGTPSELRLRDGDHDGRELLLGALIASRRGFVARAAPTFSPAEVRIFESGDPWPAYSTISSCGACRSETLLLTVAADRWSAIADLLILRPLPRPVGQ